MKEEEPMLYLGVDLGGTNIKAALVSENGEIVRKHRPHQPAPHGAGGL